MATLSKKARQGEATRGTLLEAGRLEFGGKGYADTSIDDIVGRAKMTKGAFYHHFDGKADLFLKVFENVKRELSRAAFVVHLDHTPFAPEPRQGRELKSLAERSNTEVWQQLVQRCRRYVELHTDPGLRRILLVDARSVLGWQELQRVEDEHGVLLLRGDLRIAMRRGILRPLPLKMLAKLLTGTLNEACLQVANAEQPQAALDEAMEIIEGFLDGLRDRTGAVSSCGDHRV